MTIDASNASECCSWCFATVRCTHWTYQPQDDGKPHCRLKTYNGKNGNRSPSFDSGTNGCGVSTYSGIAKKDSKCDGSDISELLAITSARDANECRDECRAASPVCTHWIMTPASAPSDMAMNCQLKSGNATKGCQVEVHLAHLVSGWITDSDMSPPMKYKLAPGGGFGDNGIAWATSTSVDSSISIQGRHQWLDIFIVACIKPTEEHAKRTACNVLSLVRSIHDTTPRARVRIAYDSTDGAGDLINKYLMRPVDTLARLGVLQKDTIEITFHELPSEDNTMRHAFKLCATARLQLPSMFPDLDTVIYRKLCRICCMLESARAVVHIGARSLTRAQLYISYTGAARDCSTWGLMPNS
jgi:hypothetical protein